MEFCLNSLTRTYFQGFIWVVSVIYKKYIDYSFLNMNQYILREVSKTSLFIFIIYTQVPCILELMVDKLMFQLVEVTLLNRKPSHVLNQVMY